MEDVLDEQGFVSRLIGSLSQTLRDGPRRRMQALAPRTPYRAALARFLLAGNNEAYLRQSVLPLQTSLPNCDDTSMGLALAPELERASKRGVVDAIFQDTTRRKQRAREDARRRVRELSWLLSSELVYDAVFPLFENPGEDPREAAIRERLVAFSDRMQSAVVASEDRVGPVQLKADLAAADLLARVILENLQDLLGSLGDDDNAAERLRNDARLPVDDDFLSSIGLFSDEGIEFDELLADLLENIGRAFRDLSSLIDAEGDARRLLRRLDDEPLPQPDQASRYKRQAVWDDAMRESCISQDRLYSFVRQLSGVISEKVDAVCEIDEGLLVRQTREARENRQRLMNQAAQEQLTLVRNVFAAVLRDSGLTLGIGAKKEDLTVVSSALRKQAADLAEGRDGAGGYFSNSVRLENLLAAGTGELTLEDLFKRLRGVASAFQDAVEQSQVDPPQAASLDLLSAPRNSLLIRWKPDALSAINTAYAHVCRELRSQGVRELAAFELVEGNDHELCTAFAGFVGGVLTQTRMFSTQTAMYIGVMPAQLNAQTLRIGLHRTVNRAKQYAWRQSAPSFGPPAALRPRDGAVVTDEQEVDVAVGAMRAYFGTI